MDATIQLRRTYMAPSSPVDSCCKYSSTTFNRRQRINAPSYVPHVPLASTVTRNFYLDGLAA